MLPTLSMGAKATACSSSAGSTYFAMPPAASARHRKAMATLTQRDTKAARRSAPLTSFATHQLFSVSVSTMPSVNTMPSTAANSAPAMLAPVSENSSAWLRVSNDRANAAPTEAMTSGWLARASRSANQRPAEREEQPRPARHARAHAGARAGHAVDRDEVIGVEAVPETEREYEPDQAGHFRMNKPSQSWFHFSCSSSTIAGSTTV